MYEDEDEGAFARWYGARRRLCEAGVGVSEWHEPSTSSERRERVAVGRAKYGYGSSRAAVTSTSPVRRSVPRRRIESTSGRPGAFTRAPGAGMPRAMVDSITDSGADARVCAADGCKVININREGPADEFCSTHG